MSVCLLCSILLCMELSEALYLSSVSRALSRCALTFECTRYFFFCCQVNLKQHNKILVFYFYWFSGIIFHSLFTLIFIVFTLLRNSTIGSWIWKGSNTSTHRDSFPFPFVVSVPCGILLRNKRFQQTSFNQKKKKLHHLKVILFHWAWDKWQLG